MSILLQLKSVATAISGPLFRPALIADMQAIETEINNLDVVTSGLAANVTTAWVSGTTYAINDFRKSPINFQTYRRLTAGAGTTDPSADPANWIAVAAGNASQVFAAAPAVNPEHVVRADQVQAQAVTAFTTGGTSTAYTLTPVPAISALAAGQKFRVKFHATPGATPTLAISGLAATALKCYDSAGTKVAIAAASIVANMLSDVEYDGVDYVVMDAIKADVAGNAAQVFSVAPATAPAHAVRLDQIPYSFRNAFINGDDSVNQVNNPTNAATGTAVTVTAAAAAASVIDRWYAQVTGQNITAQQVAGTGQFKYAMKLIAGATGPTTTLFGTRLEGKDCYKYINQPMNIQVGTFGDVARTVTWTAYYANALDNFATKTQIATGTINATNAAAVYNVQFNAGANAGNGICVEFTTGSLTNATGFQEYYGRQLEQVPSGSTTGTAFEFLPYASQLTRCQRYLACWYGLNSLVGTGSVDGTTTNVGVRLSFMVPLRASPTAVVVSNPNHFNANVGANANVVSAVTFSSASIYGFSLALTIAAQTLGQASSVYANNAASQLYLTGSELW